MIGWFRSRSRTTTAISLGLTPFASAAGGRFSRGSVDGDGVGHLLPADELVHVDGRAGEEHRPALGDGDHGDRVRLADRREAGALERVDGHVHLGRLAVADLLAVVEHRRLVLLALADDDDAAHGDGVEHRAHRVDRRLVGGVLVAAADPAPAAERGRLGHADELEGEVPIGNGAVRHDPRILRHRNAPERAPRRMPSTPTEGSGADSQPAGRDGDGPRRARPRGEPLRPFRHPRVPPRGHPPRPERAGAPQLHRAVRGDGVRRRARDHLPPLLPRPRVHARPPETQRDAPRHRRDDRLRGQRRPRADRRRGRVRLLVRRPHPGRRDLRLRPRRWRSRA